MSVKTPTASKTQSNTASAAGSNAKITKKHLVKDIADFIHMSQNDVEKFLDAFIHVVSDHLQMRNDVRLTGFGIFGTRDRKASVARNPATGEEIQVQASVVPTFRPGSPLREKINAESK